MKLLESDQVGNNGTLLIFNEKWMGSKSSDWICLKTKDLMDARIIFHASTCTPSTRRWKPIFLCKFIRTNPRKIVKNLKITQHQIFDVSWNWKDFPKKSLHRKSTNHQQQAERGIDKLVNTKTQKCASRDRVITSLRNWWSNQNW